MTAEPERGEAIVLQWGSRSVVARLRESERRVLKVEVDPEGIVTVYAPSGVELTEIARRAEQKGAWIFRQLDEIGARPTITPPRRYVSGETHLMLGGNTASKSNRPTRLSSAAMVAE